MAARPGLVVDGIDIDEPYPRSADLRVFTRFAAHDRRLHDALLDPSGAGADRAPA